MKKTKFIVNETSSLDRFESVFNEHKLASSTDCPFVLPFWLHSWFTTFGAGYIPRIIEIYTSNSLLGIAPLIQLGNTVTFMGNEAVCDYQDLISTNHDPPAFCAALLHYLQKQRVSTILLGALAPDSMVLKFLTRTCNSMNIDHMVEDAGNISILHLPGSWESYLDGLTGKNRHEIRRKIRRLQEAGEVKFQELKEQQELSGHFSGFLQMFSQSREDKAKFLTEPMEAYFTRLAGEMAKRKMLNLGVLTINDKPIATTFGFIFKRTLYLYNNGFVSAYRHLSGGLLSKVFAIKQSIANDMSHFNFLKGDEKYKRHLGGEVIPLKRLKISL